MTEDLTIAHRHDQHDAVREAPWDAPLLCHIARQDVVYHA